MVCAGVILDQQANTDVLIVRHAEFCVPGGARRIARRGRGPAVFPVDAVPDRRHRAAYSIRAGFTLLRRDCATPAETRRFMSEHLLRPRLRRHRGRRHSDPDAFPVRFRGRRAGTPAGRADGRGDRGLPRRARRRRPERDRRRGRLHGRVDWADPDTRTTPTNRGDGVPDDEFVRCTTAAPCTVDAADERDGRQDLRARAQPRAVAGAYGHEDLYARRRRSLGPFNDAFQRHVFVTTMRLPNISGRRITP